MKAREGPPATYVAGAVCAVLRAITLCAPAACLTPTPVLAQGPLSATLSSPIPRLPLAEALAALATQTGLQIVYLSDVVSGLRSTAVAAGSSPEQALGRLLQGTGLRFEYITPRMIRILEVASPPRVRVAAASGGGELREVVVSASRRDEDVQHVPLTIQVLTADDLARNDTRTFDDFALELPGVTARGVGPAQNTIYVRGLATSTSGIQASGFGISFPSVAVYLDEQAVQLPGRNLDVYAADLDRIEVLEGPQGTLFGAGAEAGVVRYITKKPKLGFTESEVNAGYAVTSHGSPSSQLDAMVNVPVVDGRLAARAVIYNERRGGYIDNLPAVFTRADTDGGIGYAGGLVPINSIAINNFSIAGRDINPVSYQGLRAELLFHASETWSVLLAQSYQIMEADGVFAEMAADSKGVPQPDLSVQLYNPAYDRDRFENTALTVEGRAGALSLLYAGAYLVRNIEQVQDYTNYARGFYADYYQCINPTPAIPRSGRCFSPSSTWHTRDRNTHLSQELRVSTPGDRRVRGLAGLFYENYRIYDQTDFNYLTATPYFPRIEPPGGYYEVNGSAMQADGTPVTYSTPGAVFVPHPVTANNPATRPAGDAFFNDITRGYAQQAVFASADLDVVPARLTLTVGTRYSVTSGSELGSTVGEFGCKVLSGLVPPVCVHPGVWVNLDAQNHRSRDSGFRSRANVGWRIADDALLYYTWSQGFRAGGFNRLMGCDCLSPLAPYGNPWQAQATQNGGWQVPGTLGPDLLINDEIGWKTRWADNRLQWNGTLYQEDWRHTQIVGTGVIPSGINVNGGDYRLRGFETSIDARIGDGLTVRMAAAWNRSELVRRAEFRWRNGVPIDFTTLRYSDQTPVANPSGEIGSRLATPPFQGSLRARYEFERRGYRTFIQFGIVHQSHSPTTVDLPTADVQGDSTAYDLRPITTYDATLGIASGDWLVQIYGQNLTDVRGDLYANYAQFYRAITVSRPRTIGLHLSYKFRDGRERGTAAAEGGR